MAHVISSNENKVSDGGRAGSSLGVELSKSSQKLSVQRSAVRSIAWLGLNGVTTRQSQTNKKNGTDERQNTSSRSNKHVKRRQYAHRGRREQCQMRSLIELYSYDVEIQGRLSRHWMSAGAASRPNVIVAKPKIAKAA